MSSWLPLAALVVIFFAIAPILSNKAIQVHGPVISFLILNLVLMTLGLIWFLFSGRQDISLMTKKSLGIALIAGVFSFFWGSYYVFYLPNSTKRIVHDCNYNKFFRSGFG